MLKLIFTVALTMLVLMQPGCSKSDDSNRSTVSDQKLERILRNNVPMVVDMLHKQGVKAEDTKVVDLDFQIPDSSMDRANALVKALKELGHEAKVAYTDMKMTKPLVSAESMPTACNKEALNKLIDDMFALAEEHGCKFTGWSISMGQSVSF